jgi:hypothetical protein
MTANCSNEALWKKVPEKLDNLLSPGRLSNQRSGDSSPQTGGHRTILVQAGIVKSVLQLLAAADSGCRMPAEQ